MANREHIERLFGGDKSWNEWREATGFSPVDLTNEGFAKLICVGLELRNTDFTKSVFNECFFCDCIFQQSSLARTQFRLGSLKGSWLQGADMRGISLKAMDLDECHLRGADLRQANIVKSTFMRADLTNVKLQSAFIQECNFRGALLTEANLDDITIEKTYLDHAVLVDSSLRRARIADVNVYGISAWNLELEGATQSGLIIEPRDMGALIANKFFEPRSSLRVEKLEVAQFLNLLLDNQKIKDVIDQTSSKLVLVLGRFTSERKPVLDAVREALQHQGWVAVIFDFDQPTTRNLTETVSTIAQLSKFVVADLTDAKSIPQELQRIVPDNPSLPIQPIILSSQYEYSMFRDFAAYPWVLPPYGYESCEGLVEALKERVIGPAEAKAAEIQQRRKAIELEMRR